MVMGGPLERFRAKWKPVRVKKTRQIKNLEPRFDSIETEKALDLRQPVDVVETALDVAAMLGGGALVAELRPQLFLVVERDHQVGANLLEEVGLLDALQQDDAVGF